MPNIDELLLCSIRELQTISEIENEIAFAASSVYDHHDFMHVFWYFKNKIQ